MSDASPATAPRLTGRTIRLLRPIPTLRGEYAAGSQFIVLREWSDTYGKPFISIRHARNGTTIPAVAVVEGAFEVMED